MTDLERSDLTRWVATHCMGWPVVMFYDDDRKDNVFPRLVHQHPPEAYQFYLITGDRKTEGLFDPTTKIEHAFLLVDRMRELGWQFCIGEGDECWEAGFARDMQEFEGDALTPALAITQACRAALESAK